MKNIILLIFILCYLIACRKTTNEQALSIQECDTSQVHYQPQIERIFSNSCNSCHSGSTPSGALDFTSYEAVKLHTENNEIPCCIIGIDCMKMPIGQKGLSTCEVNTILAWQHQGCLK